MRKIVKKIMSPLYWTIKNKINKHNVESNRVAWRADIGKYVIIRADSEVGTNVTVGDYSYISGPRAYVEEASIGKFCSIARQTTIGVSGHDYRKVTTHPFIIDPFYGFVNTPVHEYQKLATVIGHDVWIGMNATVHRGVTVGHGAVIASDAVVTKNVEPYSIVAGNPAKHIKYRFEPEIIEALLKIEWWNWSDSELKKFLINFNDVNKFIIDNEDI